MNQDMRAGSDSTPPVNATEIPPGIRELFEIICERLDSASGRWRVFAEFDDGKLRFVTREEFRIPATNSRFDGE